MQEGAYSGMLTQRDGRNNKMTARKKIEKGQKFGKLTVIKEVEQNVTPCGTIQRKFLCKCECGNEVVRTMAALRDPYADCGCKKRYIKGKERTYKGRVIKSFLFTTFEGIKKRCYDEKFKQYKDYGGHGIRICDEWMNDFFTFYDWAIENGASEELTIDRIDNNGDYCPKNCRWVDRFTQANNKSNNRVIEYKGESHTIAEWSRIVGLTQSCISWRLDAMKTSVGQALGYEAINFKLHVQPITFNGVTLTIPQWAKRLNVSKYLIYSRLRYGLPIEDVLNPNYKQRRGLNEIQRLKRSLTSRGEQNGMYGKKHTEDAKRKMSKPIVQFTIDGDFVAEYYGAANAHEMTGIYRQTIVSVLKGRGKTAGGFIWKYKE